jgi:FAD/FMN-containing dehydrogenase
MKELVSWGRYPAHPQIPERVHWRGSLAAQLAALRNTAGSTLPFGNGRSYGDSCLAVSDRVLHLRPLDRLLDADWEQGVLMVEPGMTLGEILELSIPRGWFLRVTPGTRFATVGGAIANDVHGKNHHRQGTFGCHVPRFGLHRSDRGSLICSAEEHPELYAATIGGLGLTGIIEWAEVHLQRIHSSLIDGVTERFGSLDEFVALSRELDLVHEFSVAWIDCVAKGRGLGRGVYMAGDFAQEGPLEVSKPHVLSVPFTPPFSLINRLSLRLFNSTFWRKHPNKRLHKPVPYEPFFYPLDRVLHWNRIYGRRGFQQYQCVLPDEAAEHGIREILHAIAASGQGSFLAVLKRFGDRASPGLLSFPRPGLTLALDFPNRVGLGDGLFRRLDAIVLDANGRWFPAKDAHMRPGHFQRAYPQWVQLESLRDPALNSRFWQRVTA